MSSPSVDLLVTNAVIVTMDDERRILDKGHIAVRDGRIELVAAGASPPIRSRRHAGWMPAEGLFIPG